MKWSLEEVEGDILVDELDEAGNPVLRRRFDSEEAAMRVALALVANGVRCGVYQEIAASFKGAKAEPEPEHIVITKEEILAGLHDYEIDYEKRTATCKREGCGVTADQAMRNKRKARCRGKR